MRQPRFVVRGVRPSELYPTSMTCRGRIGERVGLGPQPTNSEILGIYRHPDITTWYPWWSLLVVEEPHLIYSCVFWDAIKNYSWKTFLCSFTVVLPIGDKKKHNRFML